VPGRGEPVLRTQQQEVNLSAALNPPDQKEHHMKIFTNVFSEAESFFNHPELRKDATIRQAAMSTLSSKGKRMYSTAIGKAYVYLSTGELTILQTKEGSIKVSYMTSDNQVVEAHSLPNRADPAKRLWMFTHADPSAQPALAIVEALLSPNWPETMMAVRQAAYESGHPVPTDELRGLPGTNDQFVTAIMHLSDTMYYEGKAQESLIVTEDDKPVMADYHTKATTNDGVRPERISKAISAEGDRLAQPGSGSSNTDLLIQLTQRGGVAMLVGPPATFKTETVKYVIMKTGSQVVKMRGSPGVEDRDFIGTIIPGDPTPHWEDGPLARAFSMAYFKPTIIHIDEILRYLPETLNTFITAMDELSYNDALAVLKSKYHTMPANEFGPMVDSLLQRKDDRFYMLELPNGQMLFAPKRHLTWMMTTNWGEDHLQVANNVDSALLSRTDLIIDYTRAERTVTQPIYQDVAGSDTVGNELAKIVSEFEDALYHEYEKGEMGLSRPMDPRKSIAMLKAARSAVNAGMSIPDAIQQAASVTAVPHCVPRAPNGTLVEATKVTVLNLLKNVLKATTVFNVPSRRVSK